MNTNLRQLNQGLGSVNSAQENILYFNPDSSCVLYLPLWWTELGGSTIVDRMASTSCTVTNATWGTQGATFGGNGYIELTNDGSTASPLNFTSGSFTIWAWVKTTNLAVENIILCRGLLDSDGYYWVIPAAGRLQFYTYQGAASQTTYSDVGQILINTSYFVSLTRSGAACKTYKNVGATVTDITSVAGSHINPVTCARTTKIGIYDNKVYSPFIGTMGEIGVQNRVLSILELQNIMLATKWRYGL